MESSCKGGDGATKRDLKFKTFSLNLKGLSSRKSAFDKSLVTDADVKEESDYVTEVSNNKIKSTRKPEKKKIFVIPPLENRNVLRKKLKCKDGATIEREIQEELFNAASQEVKQEPQSPPSDKKIIINSNFDLDTHVEVPTLDAYEQMPIEEFGTALLRGMGWKPGQAIGARCTTAAKPVEVKLRLKGLGLGAEVQSNAQKEHLERLKRMNNDKRPLVVKAGAYVKVICGSNEGKYGRVDGMDEDGGRVHLRLAISKEKVSCNEAFVVAVTKEEYNDRGKCLNRERYDDYKRTQEKIHSRVHSRCEKNKSVERRRR